MAWTPLPEDEGEGTFVFPARILANNLGRTMDDMLDVALRINRALDDAIESLRDQALESMEGLTLTFNPSLATSDVFSPTSPLSIPGAISAPAMPAVGRVIDATAYDLAFARAEGAALRQEVLERHQAEKGAAANGIGLSMPMHRAMQDAAAMRRAQVVNEAALAQSIQQTADERDDTKWSYETRLAYWRDRSSNIIQRFQMSVEQSQQHLAQQMERRAWIDMANTREMRRAELEALDAREVQKIIIGLYNETALNYTNALAEQFKAFLAAVSYSLSSGSTVTGSTYTGG
jgi:hypothetical protein